MTTAPPEHLKERAAVLFGSLHQAMKADPRDMQNVRAVVQTATAVMQLLVEAMRIAPEPARAKLEESALAVTEVLMAANNRLQAMKQVEAELWALRAMELVVIH